MENEDNILKWLYNFSYIWYQTQKKVIKWVYLKIIYLYVHFLYYQNIY